MIPAVIERCAGIDIGKKFMVVCVMTGEAKAEPGTEIRRFNSVRGELVKLRDWLKSQGCTHVVMESAGVYWKPVLNVLEDDPEYSVHVVLANPQQVKAVTGHKTDPHDAKWLAHLLRHAMIRPSFIPPRTLRDLREFTRRRRKMIGLAAEERNRVQKVLEDANVKIGDVLSDVFGLSGQLMLEALVEGNNDAADIAQLAKGNARKKIAELTASLEGAQMRDAHRRLIRHAMRHMAFLAEEIEALDEDVRLLIESSGLTRSHTLQGLPAIQETAAAAILAECGPEMKQFPEAARFTSWAGLAPGNNQSADKRKRAPALKGNPHIKAAVVEAAWSASRTNGSEFRQRYERLRNRIGHKRAIVATARILAMRVYETLASGVPYQCPADGLPPRNLKRLVRHHSRRLKCLHRWLKQGYPDGSLPSTV